MAGWKRILCASDLGDASAVGIAEAARLARRDGAELQVYHALPIELAPGVATLAEMPPAVLAPMDAIQERAEAALRARVAEVAADLPVKVFVEVAAVPTYAAIVNRAEAVGADLVVLTSHGASGIRRVLGSTAEKVTRYAHAAVLIARPRPDDARQVVLAATDLSDPSLPAIRAGADEAQRRGAHLVVVHCFGSPPEMLTALATETAEVRDGLRRAAEERLCAAVAEVTDQAETRVLAEPAAAAIRSLATELRAELVVVGTKGRTGLRRMLLGSTAEDVVRHAEQSVLVVRLHPAPAP